MDTQRLMKLFATFAALATAQQADEGQDRWSYYDYSIGGHSHGYYPSSNTYGGKVTFLNLRIDPILLA